MTITYHSVQYYVKDGDTWTGKAGFTNDPALFEQHLNNTAAEFHQGMKYAWSARDDPDDTTKADDLEAYKRKLGNDAEETAPGYWPTRGIKEAGRQWNEAFRPAKEDKKMTKGTGKKRKS